MIGLIGCALLLVNSVMTVTYSHRYSLRSRRILFLIASLLAFLPLKGLSVAGYVRGVTGDVSVTTFILLMGASISLLYDKELYDGQSFFVLMLLVMGGAIFLYPFALGLTYFDSYSLGYGSKLFIVALFLLSLTVWYLELYLVVFCVVLGVIAYLAQTYESRNLWDYLIDPLITFYALFWLMTKVIRQISQASLARTRPQAS
ncbi:MAG: hypothetical protein ACE5MK_02050 [Acidobacteriota bacterium]